MPLVRCQEKGKGLRGLVFEGSNVSLEFSMTSGVFQQARSSGVFIGNNLRFCRNKFRIIILSASKHVYTIVFQLQGIRAES